MLALSAAGADAIPAYPGKIKARQADGTEIIIQRLGDEHCNMTVTDDGYPLVFNVKSGNYEYALLQKGSLVASGINAAMPQSRDANVQQFLMSVDRAAVMKQFVADCGLAQEKVARQRAKRLGGAAKTMRISDVPTIGKHDVLVILVQFADKKFSTMDDPAQYYDKFFHEEGFSENDAKGSAHDFYSYGSNNLYDPQFKVYGPVTLSGSYSDYAGASQGTANTYKLIQEAVPMVKEQYGVDFRQFDTDGDGNVDNVYCIYAGYGRADSYDSKSIWPHSGNLSVVSKTDQTFKEDGVTIDRYTVSQEINGQTDKATGIGTFVHEFGHVLGLADHYNTSSSSLSNQPGAWDVMAAGSYNDNQNCPPTFSAFERYSLGWMSLTELDAATDTLINAEPYEDTSLAYRVSVPGKDNEYFIVENRQQKGWDTYLPGHGLLVWHIDEDKDAWDRNAVNTDQNHQRVDIVEASNYPTASGTRNDSFPGGKNVTSYNFKSWAGDQVFGFGWLKENEETGNTQFVLNNTDYRMVAPEVEVDDIKGITARVSWKATDMATDYSVTVCRGNQIVAQTSAKEAGSFDVTGLEPETEYVAKVVGSVNSVLSDTASVAFTTLPRQIEETKPVALESAGYDGTSFIAQWQPVKDADSYEVTLLTRTHDGVAYYGTGFDNYTAGDSNLPEGWTISDHRSAYSSYYGEAAPSVRLASDNAQLVASVPGSKVNSVAFWHRASKTGIILSIDQCKDGQWTSVWSYNADRPRSLKDTVAIDEADSIRFVLTRDAGVKNGYAFLDDVYLGYLYDRYSPEKTVKVDATGDSPCRYTFSGLYSSLQYAYAVRAFMGDRQSQLSDTIKVEVATAIRDINAEGERNVGSSAVYDLTGRYVGKTTADGRLPEGLPRGVYVVRGRKVVSCK